MIVVGITGQSGAGKTTVSEIFRSCGFMHIDTDKIASEVMKPGSPCLAETVAEFGGEILDESGSLNRGKLAGIVFSDNDKLDSLNRITHKYIIERVNRLRDSFSQKRGCGIVVDGAALIESGYSEECDYLVAVTSRREDQKSRITKRDTLTPEAADKRLSAQKSNEYYTEGADFVIENCTDLKSLQSITEAIIFQITEGR